MKKLIISTLVVAMATPAFADKESDGTIIGAIIGGLTGNIVGGKKGKTERTVIGALLGGLIGNRIGNEMDQRDRAELERASNDCFNGNAGRSVDWQGNRYRGRVSTTREGYYRRGDGGRVRCRDYRSEIYRGNEREVVQGTVCESRNGWERTERRDIDYGGSSIGGNYGGGDLGYDNGVIGGGALNQGQIVELGFVNPVSRRSGGDYLTVNVNGLNLRKVTLRASGDRLKIYRVIATGINGNQMELVAHQSADQFLYLGSSASFDATRVGSQIVRLDILAEAFGANGLGISISGEIGGNNNGNGQIIPRDYGIGGAYGRAVPMSEIDLNALISEMRREAFDDDKIEVMANWASYLTRRGQFISASQLIRIQTMMSFDDGRADAVRIAVDIASDAGVRRSYASAQELYQLLRGFRFDNEKVEAVRELAGISSIARAELSIVTAACAFDTCRQSVRQILFGN